MNFGRPTEQAKKIQFWQTTPYENLKLPEIDWDTKNWEEATEYEKKLFNTKRMLAYLLPILTTRQGGILAEPGNTKLGLIYEHDGQENTFCLKLLDSELPVASNDVSELVAWQIYGHELVADLIYAFVYDFPQVIPTTLENECICLAYKNENLGPFTLENYLTLTNRFQNKAQKDDNIKIFVSQKK